MQCSGRNGQTTPVNVLSDTIARHGVEWVLLLHERGEERRENAAEFNFPIMQSTYQHDVVRKWNETAAIQPACLPA